MPHPVLAAFAASALTASALSATAGNPDTSPDEASATGTAHVAPSTPEAAAAVRADRPDAPVAVLGAPVRHVTVVAATYTVRAGDTVGHIAARLGTTVAAVVAANGLDARAFIREGQVLTVPSGGGSAPAVPAAASAGSHTVRTGDTVGALAVRYGTTSAAIVAANGLDGRAFIRDGQVLTIPGGSGGSGSGASSAAAPAAAATGSYTVRAGDTLSHVAARAGTSVASVRDANPGLDAAGTIRIGQVLAVPGAASTSSAPMSNTFAGRTYPSATVQAATVNRDVLAARSVPGAGAMQQLVADTARRHGVDPALAQAVAFQESGFNMRAVSPANAVGAMQVIPSSGEWASMLAGRPIDLLDPQDNALAGVLILKAHAATGADQATVIAAYYQGMGSVTRNGLYSDTRRYVANVQTLMARFG